MRPSLFLYEELDGKYKLYLNEISTLESLKGFSADSPINVIEFGATNYKGCGWTTVKEIPKLEKVTDLVNFLDKEGGIGLITVEVLINNSVKLGTHDDGEAHLLFEKMYDCAAIIRRWLFEVPGAELDYH